MEGQAGVFALQGTIRGDALAEHPEPQPAAPGPLLAVFTEDSEHQPLHGSLLLSEKLQGSLLLLVHPVALL